MAEPKKVSCLGCLGLLIFLGLWALLTLLPLALADDLFGLALDVHWSLPPATAPPAAASPTGTGAGPAGAGEDTVVRVPAGTQMTLSVKEVDAKEVDSQDRLDVFQPTVRCFARDGDLPWVTLPPQPVPVVAGVGGKSPKLSTVRLLSFRVVSGRLTVRCVGSEYVELDRDDPGLQHKLHLYVLAARIAWPILTTALLWAPIGLIRRRRERRRLREWSSPPPPEPVFVPEPPWGTPPP
jgi:hypothetical protein